MLEAIGTLSLFHYFLVFCRIGSAFMVFPGFGEVYVSPRIRLMMVMAITFILTPVLEDKLPGLPSGVLATIFLIFTEIIIGAFIGALMRIVQGTLHTAGMIIAFQSSLASALLFDATQSSQGSVFGNFMTLIGVTLIFTTNMHHVMLGGVVNSFNMFPSGQYFPVGDFAELASNLLSKGFLVAFQISSPLLMAGTLIYLAAGILGRLMPNMQVFFVLIPIQIYISFIILAAILSATMMWYMQYLRDTIDMFL